MNVPENRRILLIDDSPSIHEDFTKILAGGDDAGKQEALSDAKAAFFGTPSEGAESSEAGAERSETFELVSAHQGQEGLAKVQEAVDADQPFAMAFVDVRMPPGWDGIETIARIWEVDPNLEVVICTAYSDYSWNQTIDELGQSNQLLILKKPFDPVEIQQLASALTCKWNAARAEERMIADLTRAEGEARAYAASLETSNQALQSAIASAEKAAELKDRFLNELATQVSDNLGQMLERLSEGALAGHAESTLDASRDLVRTLNVVLDLQALENGSLQVDPAPSSPTEVVVAAVSRHAEAAERQGLAIMPEIPMALPERLELDAPRLGQALDSLIQRAMSISTTGTIRVRAVFLSGEDWQRGQLRFEVLHTGPVPTPEEAAGCFEPFTSETDGMGLAFCKGLVHAMGGEVRAGATDDGSGCFRLEANVQVC